MISIFIRRCQKKQKLTVNTTAIIWFPPGVQCSQTRWLPCRVWSLVTLLAIVVDLTKVIICWLVTGDQRPLVWVVPVLESLSSHLIASYTFIVVPVQLVRNLQWFRTLDWLQKLMETKFVNQDLPLQLTRINSHLCFSEQVEFVGLINLSCHYYQIKANINNKIH